MRSGHHRRLQQASVLQDLVRRTQEAGNLDAQRERIKQKIISRQDKQIYEEAHEKKKVIVIGGGFSGLSAAYELLSSGFNVTVIERRKRVGGRVYSSNDWVQGKNLEHGGELVGSRSCHVNCHHYMTKFGIGFIPLAEPEVDPENQEQEVDPMFHVTNAMHFLFAKLSAACSVTEPWRGKEGQEKKTRKYDNTSLHDWFYSPKVVYALGKAYELATSFPPMKSDATPEELVKIANDRLVQIRNVVRHSYSNHVESDFLSKATTEYINDFLVVSENLFEHNNGQPCTKQSLLFTLLTVEASSQAYRKAFKPDGSEAYEALADLHFLTDNEQGRMEGGNQTLAKRFEEEILALGGVIIGGSLVKRVAFKKDNCEVLYESIDENTKFYVEKADTCDYIVNAIPVKKWETIEYVGARDTFDNLQMHPQMGKLIKVLFKINNRFWEKSKTSPSGAYDMFLTWETTESQGSTGDYCFVCFAGGRAVMRILDEYREGYKKDAFISWMASRTREQIDGSDGLVPEDMIKAIESVNLMDWSEIGYSCSAPGEITTVGPKVHDDWNDRMWLAGEHACLYSNPGFMEGALSSGRRVAKVIRERDSGETEKIVLCRDYKVVADIIYDGVIHGHPRIQVPIETGDVNVNGSYGKGKITNKETGKSMRISGVNHWNWDGSHFYFWPVYHPEQYSTELLNEYKAIVHPGAQIKVSLEIETFRN